MPPGLPLLGANPQGDGGLAGVVIGRFVQATSSTVNQTISEAIEDWRQHLQRFGVWANKPIPLFPYPGLPEYARK
jgi:hypothetical protein